VAQRAQPETDEKPDPIPEPLRRPFRSLQNRVTRLHLRWMFFHQLFATGPRRVALLNESAGGLFSELQQIMLDDLVLATARLLDRRKCPLPQTGQREVASLLAVAVAYDLNLWGFRDRLRNEESRALLARGELRLKSEMDNVSCSHCCTSDVRFG